MGARPLALARAEEETGVPLLRETLRRLQSRLGLTFRNPALLEQAFTHTSYVNEQRGKKIEDNERLEFLGDAVLQLVVSEYLFRRHPGLAEGELTRMRSSIVCEPSLVRFAEALGFGDAVLLGKGEERTGGRTRPSLLADVFEAFVGALYLDQGLEGARSFLERRMLAHLPEKGQADKDFKTRLQEKVQTLGFAAPEYQVVEERGPSHDREFVVEVLIAGRPAGRGSGRSKKEAEQQAAERTLSLIETTDLSEWR
jgi:ribonuclease-3